MLRIILLLIFLFPYTIFAQSSVWKISKADHSLYIGGTCHLLRASDYPLPEEFEIAYEAAEMLVFEMDPTIAGTPDFALKLMRKASYDNALGLKKVLSKHVYETLAEQCARNGLSIETLDKMKPFMVVTTLLLQELAAYGVSEEGVDLHFHKRALNDNKQIQSLETPDFQIDLITSIGEGIEDEIVLYGLEDISNIQKRFDELVLAWRSGEIKALEESFLAEVSNYPDLYARILIDRNLEWFQKIKKHLNNPEVEFVLVGVAHLAGDKGLVSLLKAEGYSVEQVVH